MRVVTKFGPVLGRVERFVRYFSSVYRTKQWRKLYRIKINDCTHSISSFRNVPYSSSARFQYATDPKPWIQDRPVVDQTPHFPQVTTPCYSTIIPPLQPDEFNKANWKTLPRIIKESEVSYHDEDMDLPLNIFTPSLTDPKPVIVYVHGGSLVGWRT